MPDLRYHLISLISVFLALAIGILLGVAMVDRGVVQERVRAEISDIERRLDQQEREIARRDNQIDRLQAQTSADQEMMDTMSQAMISGSLQGSRLAIVVGPYANPTVAGALQTDLETAGAEITTVQSLPAPEALNEVTAQESTILEQTTDLQTAYADLAREVLGTTGEVEEPSDGIIFVGGGRFADEDPPRGTGEALFEAQSRLFEVWQDAGARVVAAEPSNTGRSEIELYADSGIPDVHYAEQSAGRAAIVKCVATDCEGSYGTDESASQSFPPPG